MSACRQATAGAGVIRAEVIDGAKLTRFTKWGRKYLPGTAWKDRTLLNKNASLWRCIFYFAILVTPRPDDYVGKIVKGYRRKM